MGYIVILGAAADLVDRVRSVPGHVVAARDRAGMDDLARVNGLESVLTVRSDTLADMVILGDGLLVAEALSLAELIGTLFPSVDRVLVAEPDTELVLRAMRSGVRDIVSRDVSEDELKVLMHRSERTPTATRRPNVVSKLNDLHRVIVVSGPKGGVGRSTVATNVALGLARSAPMDTVLIDLDLQFGDAGGLLDITPSHTIAEAFGSASALDSLILKTLLTVHDSGFYVLCSGESPATADEMSADQIRHLLQQLSSQFRYVVVDTAAGLNEHTLAAIDEASDLLLVTSMDLSSARALKKEVDILVELEIAPLSRHVIMNFAERQTGIDVRQVEAAIGLPIEVVVPRSREVRLGNDLGRPVMEYKRRGGAGKAFERLISLIHADEEITRINKHRGVLVP